MMREALVIKLVCATCGTNMVMQYNEKRVEGQCVDEEPTGAEMVRSVIPVEPCRVCERKVDEIKNAVRVLVDSVSE